MTKDLADGQRTPCRMPALAACRCSDPVPSETPSEVSSSLDGLDISTPTIARCVPRCHLLGRTRCDMEVHVRHSLVGDESVVLEDVQAIWRQLGDECPGQLVDHRHDRGGLIDAQVREHRYVSLRDDVQVAVQPVIPDERESQVIFGDDSAGPVSLLIRPGLSLDGLAHRAGLSHGKLHEIDSARWLETDGRLDAAFDRGEMPPGERLGLAF
jgi:hypothetical protein